MPGDLGIAAAGAGAGLLGSAINAGANIWTNQQNIKQANHALEVYQEEAQKAREWEDYSSQVKRLEAAGLNPNLAYGSGASGASYHPAQYQPSHLISPLQGAGFQEALQTAASLVGIKTQLQQSSILSERLRNWSLNNGILDLKLQGYKDPAADNYFSFRWLKEHDLHSYWRDLHLHGFLDDKGNYHDPLREARLAQSAKWNLSTQLAQKRLNLMDLQSKHFGLRNDLLAKQKEWYTFDQINGLIGTILHGAFGLIGKRVPMAKPK